MKHAKYYRYLFLNIDSSLRSYCGCIYDKKYKIKFPNSDVFSSMNLEALKFICENIENLRIVLFTNTDPYLFTKLEDSFNYFKIPMYWDTLNKLGRNSSNNPEILNDYINENNLADDDYIVIDNDIELYLNIEKFHNNYNSFIKISSNGGLTFKDYDLICEIFKIKPIYYSIANN